MSTVEVCRLPRVGGGEEEGAVDPPLPHPLMNHPTDRATQETPVRRWMDCLVKLHRVITCGVYIYPHT